MRELLGDFLRSRGYDVEAVADGQTALATIEREVPDLLVLDLMMPGMNG
ncbi:MAG: response regulator, partial [Candidatus Binatia bacterium]